MRKRQFFAIMAAIALASRPHALAAPHPVPPRANRDTRSGYGYRGPGRREVGAGQCHRHTRATLAAIGSDGSQRGRCRIGRHRESEALNCIRANPVAGGESDVIRSG